MTYKKRKVWIFTFEYAGIAKVGGLGEVPANQAKNLVDKFEVTVFIPSHGQLEKLQKNSKWICLPFKCEGVLNNNKVGLFENENKYSISFSQGKIDDVEIIILSGNNSFTKKYLDDEIVYNPDSFNIKMCLFSLGMKGYFNNLILNHKDLLPDIIHMHDYHVVISYINIKQELFKNRLNIASIITLHLLTWPRYELEFYKACGVDDSPIQVLMKNGPKLLYITDIFEICGYQRKESGDILPPTVEKIGAFVSDLVTTVSNSYLISDIIPNLGQDLIAFKSDFIWDGCDWDYNEIYQKVMDNLSTEICDMLKISKPSEITRNNMKDYLLTYKISNLSQSPLINSKKVLETINEISNGNPFIKNGNIKGFHESGPLAITTGRISRQKGFDIIFQAIPEIINVIPNVKILLLILPTEYSLKEIKEYANYVKLYPENLRIIFGVAAEIYQIAHIAADVYCALSRWEPFGIMALEAMASKLPVIATKVGGLQESVIDIREDPEKGTGLLVEKDNPIEFAQALIIILKLAELSEKIESGKSKKEIINILNSIPNDNLKSYVLSEMNFYKKLKENCSNRVHNYFKWNKVTKKLIDLYEIIIEKNVKSP